MGKTVVGGGGEGKGSKKERGRREGQEKINKNMVTGSKPTRKSTNLFLCSHSS